MPSVGSSSSVHSSLLCPSSTHCRRIRSTFSSTGWTTTIAALLPRVPLQRDFQAVAKESTVTPVDTDEYDPPTQPLLTKQIEAEDRYKTFCAEIANEVELGCLKSWSSCGTMIELMVESIKEVTASIEDVDYVADQDLFLRDLMFGDAVEKWLRDRCITPISRVREAIDQQL